MNREELIAWVQEYYGIEPDYPWMDGNAVLRHPDNRKWFALLMEVGRDKLGLPGAGTVDVLNVKCDPILMGSLRGQPGFLPAYHMSKDKWITVLLDGSVSGDQIQMLVDMSYDLTRNKRRPKDVRQ